MVSIYIWDPGSRFADYAYFLHIRVLKPLSVTRIAS